MSPSDKNRDPRRSVSDPRIFFPSADPELIYLGNGQEDPPTSVRGRQALLLVERRTGRLRQALFGQTIIQGTCLPNKKCYLTSSSNNTFFVWDETRLAFERTLKFPAPYRPRWVFPDATGDTLYLGFDGKPRIERLDAVTLNGLTERTIDQSRAGGLAYLLRDPTSGELYALTEEVILNDRPITRLTADLQAVASFRLPWLRLLCGQGYLISMVIDNDRKELYATAILDGAVYIFDLTSGRYVGQVPVGVGVRQLAYDAVGHRLFASNYVDGTITVLDMTTRQSTDRIFIGKRAREMFYDSTNDRLYATSVNGWLEIDVSAGKKPGV
ncbi:MAG: hypothetical protein GX444_01885 [Myxococcales bacterium]|nr:hypothetical protein [Myxococcales bacterium]